MADIREVKPPNLQRNIDIQADMLAAVENVASRLHQLEGLIIVGVRKDGSTEHQITLHNNHPQLVGAVTIMLHRLVETGGTTEL